MLGSIRVSSMCVKHWCVVRGSVHICKVASVVLKWVGVLLVVELLDRYTRSCMSPLIRSSITLRREILALVLCGRKMELILLKKDCQMRMVLGIAWTSYIIHGRRRILCMGVMLDRRLLVWPIL